MTFALSITLIGLIITLFVIVFRRKCEEHHWALIAEVAAQDVDASWWRERLETIYGEAGARESAPHLYT